MNRPAQYAETVGDRLSLSDYYLWDEPQAGLSVYVKFETLDRLQVAILGELKESQHGVETGGILKGTRERVDGRTLTLVEEFELVPRIGRSGRFYNLSKADTVRFASALERRESVVGYFRSHLRQDLYLSADDLDVIRKFFSEDDIFLLIRPLSARACTAAVFFWEDGRIESEFAHNEVPLSPVQIPSVANPRLTVPSAPEQPVRSRSSRWAVGLSALAVTVLGAAGYRQWRYMPERRSATPRTHTALAAAVPPVKRDNNPEPIKLMPTPVGRTEPSVGKPLPEIKRAKDTVKAKAPLVWSPPAPQVKTSIAAPELPDPTLTSPVRAPSVSEMNEVRAGQAPVPPAPIVVSPPAVLAGPRSSAYSRPQAIKRVQPTLSREVQSMMTTDIELEVLVSLDADGRVVDARIESTKGSLPELVVSEALRAAKLSRFRPARRNDVTVPSEMTLSFRFPRTAN
jgi:proteasome lid subunit RPN8/RPN11